MPAFSGHQPHQIVLIHSRSRYTVGSWRALDTSVRRHQTRTFAWREVKIRWLTSCCCAARNSPFCTVSRVTSPASGRSLSFLVWKVTSDWSSVLLLRDCAQWGNRKKNIHRTNPKEFCSHLAPFWQPFVPCNTSRRQRTRFWASWLCWRMICLCVWGGGKVKMVEIGVKCHRCVRW